MTYKCHMKTQLKQKKDFSAGGIVWDARKKKLLAVYVQNLAGRRVWTFPKGHPEKGETDRAAALREVREETGWTCEIVKKFMDVRYAYTHKGFFIKKTVRWFLMTPLRKTNHFDEDEIIRCRWMSPRGAGQKMIYPSDRALLAKFGKYRYRVPRGQVSQ